MSDIERANLSRIMARDNSVRIRQAGAFAWLTASDKHRLPLRK
jgi:hypothetical protein